MPARAAMPAGDDLLKKLHTFRHRTRLAAYDAGWEVSGIEVDEALSLAGTLIPLLALAVTQHAAEVGASARAQT